MPYNEQRSAQLGYLDLSARSNTKDLEILNLRQAILKLLHVADAVVAESYRRTPDA